MTARGETLRFNAALAVVGGTYVALVAAMLAADLAFLSMGDLTNALRSPAIRHAIRLSLVTCSVTTVLSMLVAVPLGYLLSRTRFWGKAVVETLIDIPFILPPLVVGLSLLILFQTPPGRWVESTVESLFGTRITFAVPAIVLAQFTVCAAFAIRTMRVTFDQITPRTEQVALTLGCTRALAFWRVALPEARRGIVSSAAIAWARAMGEFGPVLLFAGMTRFRTEVLSTSVFLEFSSGHVEAALAVSMLMVVVAMAVLLLLRSFGLRGGTV